MKRKYILTGTKPHRLAKGKTVKVGAVMELTPAQAASLVNRVTPVPVPEAETETKKPSGLKPKK